MRFNVMKLLIVDDHSLIRDGLRALLEMQAHVIFDARNGDECIHFVTHNQDLDAVFIDLNMPGKDGIDTITGCLSVRPRLPIIVLSSSEDPHDVRRAFLAGALGYVPKTASSTTLVNALNMVIQGEVYVPSIMLTEQAANQDDVRLINSDVGTGTLTDRQNDVLRLVMKGMSNKEVARALSLSEKTIKVHMSGIFRALKVVNRAQAVAVSQRVNIV